jgi:NAD(P)-dependent dehydrogenase (short-subunit alcohol dehydrogenase family)
MPHPLMVRPELLTLDLGGRLYIVTGANSGIGLITTEQLVRQGATVVMACRRQEAGESAARAIRGKIPAAQIEVMTLDLGNISSIHTFATAFRARHAQLHGLINNAGIMNTPLGRTADGFETQFGTNHLGHFLLTALLLDTLKTSAPSRIVNVASLYHVHARGRVGAIHFEDPNYEERRYDGWEAYAQSKLANVLHARELARRLAGTGVTAVSLNPGWVRTNLIRNTAPVWLQNLLQPILRYAGGMIEPWEGAQSTLHCLLAPEVAEHSGEYYSQIGLYHDRSARAGGWPLVSPNPLAHDDKVAQRLWDVSEKLVGLAD